MTTLTVTPLKSDDELYCRYSGQTSRQLVDLILNLETGELSAAYSSIIGPGQSMRAFHRRDIEWAIPPLRVMAFERYTGHLVQDLQIILDHSKVEWDGSNSIGELDDEAWDAYQRIEDKIHDWQPEPHEVWEPWGASDWFSQTSTPLEDLGLSARSTDEEIEAAAEQAVKDADAVLDADDVAEYLKLVRDEALEDEEDDE